MHYDVFNGDADGIIALLQLRLAHPKASHLVTGVKRDIQLLAQLEQAKRVDSVTVLDISLDKNRAALETLLKQGAQVWYADHHFAGEDRSDLATARLETHIDTDANTCTGLIVDMYLDGAYHHWAITAAYGDNLMAKADELAMAAGLDAHQRAQLQELGTLLNYNGYGRTVYDLHFHPADLYQALLAYPSPFDVIADRTSPFYQLQSAYQQDMAQAQAITPRYQSETLALFELPNAPWSHRVSGVYGNWLANQTPQRAHAVLTPNACLSTFTLSLRAPLNNKQGAVDICRQFETGGGRAAAAGINQLPHTDIEKLIALVETTYSI
ncbi:acetyltransferase [Vibrio sp. 10N.286.49.B3]|uniref:acetyltransferase n=1 Tax=Vibrio sp. 10N.286.49.B3 TaxID=1880855 RepID=UPI000C8358AC|nr:acetyltransferase [Vibrio sp. 10N.286.49.B3]PMH42158.1 acetyltransferase [Vibrio sp. 10N.286.49.B3]